jgi:predicted Zn-dependent protease
MTKVGYDPRPMADMFTTLARASKGEGEGGKLPGWLSTHPDPENRAETATQRAAAVKDADKLEVGRDRFLAMIDGMTFGDDPRQGFFQGDAFLHPDLQFRVDFPQGWQKANTAAAVLAQSPKKDAIIQLSLAGKVSPEEAAKKFFSQKGVKPSQLSGGGGLPPNARFFEAQTEQGDVAGLVSFAAHKDVTLGILAYTPSKNIQTYAPVFQKVVGSFGPLTDPAALAVQPAKVNLVKVPRDMTLAEFNAQFPSTVPLEVLATVNGVDKDGRLQAGRTAKRIVGGVPPAPAAAAPKS